MLTTTPMALCDTKLWICPNAAAYCCMQWHNESTRSRAGINYDVLQQIWHETSACTVSCWITLLRIMSLSSKTTKFVDNRTLAARDCKMQCSKCRLVHWLNSLIWNADPALEVTCEREPAAGPDSLFDFPQFSHRTGALWIIQQLHLRKPVTCMVSYVQIRRQYDPGQSELSQPQTACGVTWLSCAPHCCWCCTLRPFCAGVELFGPQYHEKGSDYRVETDSVGKSTHNQIHG